MIAALVSLAVMARSAAAVTPEALRARYANVKSLTADVVQVKTGKYWARPLEMRLRLQYAPGRFVWETLAPVRSTVVIADGGMTVTGPDGVPRDAAPLSNDPRFAAIVRFVRALFAVDLPAIERSFELSYGPGLLVAKPRPDGDVQLFQAIRLRFDDALELRSLELDTAAERTSLIFSHLEHGP